MEKLASMSLIALYHRYSKNKLHLKIDSRIYFKIWLLRTEILEERFIIYLKI